ncbi:MAG TPA: Flp family type IVb pilin [Kofleriaceae bacterium]|nr:Flp family type IVb pilin [Kofleriaceae bacterium]
MAKHHLEAHPPEDWGDNSAAIFSELEGGNAGFAGIVQHASARPCVENVHEARTMHAAYVMRAALQSEDGVTMIEYAILAALIALAMIISVIAIKTALEGLFTGVAAGFAS